MRPNTVAMARVYLEAKGALSYTEVAVQFNVTRNTVAGAVFRLRASLKAVSS